MEPMSLVTNFLIAFVCFILFSKLFSQKKEDEFVHYWSLFFLTFAFSTFSGGLAHLFFKYTGVPGKIPVFSLAVIANFFIDRACFTLVENQSRRNNIEYLLIGKVVLSILLMVFLMNSIGKKIFLIVQFNTVITAAGFLVWFSLKTKSVSKAWKFFVTGVLILIITAGVQIAKLNIHLWFNKDDFSHILITLTMIFFFWGVRSYKRDKLI